MNQDDIFKQFKKIASKYYIQEVNKQANEDMINSKRS